MLRAEKVVNYENVRFEQDQERPYILNIVQLDAWNYETLIGRFNFYTKDGFLVLLNGKRKEYTRFQPLMNNFFKYNEMFGWNSKAVENAQTAGKEMSKAEKKAEDMEQKELMNEKAAGFLNKVINGDENTIECLQSFKGKTDEELMSVINNTFKGLIGVELANEILAAIKEVFSPVVEVAVSVEENVTAEESKEVNETVETKEPVKYYYYKQVFDTYMDAYNYALSNMSPVTMVLASNHSTMTNERLMELEKEYIFNKTRMSYEDMKEYFAYISELPVTLDQEDRYYALRDRIKRHEYKEQQRINRENEQREKMKGIDSMLKGLYAMGMTKKEYSSMVTYYMNGEQVYYWMSGISTDKMHSELMEVCEKLGVVVH